MLKDKNYEKALANVDGMDIDVKMPLEGMARLQVELEAAERAYDEQAALVKKHNNEIYRPMCDEKTAREIRMHELRITFDRVKAQNPGFAALVKLASKSAKKSK